MVLPTTIPVGIRASVARIDPSISAVDRAAMTDVRDGSIGLGVAMI
jgi:hypothetical protein